MDPSGAKVMPELEKAVKEAGYDAERYTEGGAFGIGKEPQPFVGEQKGA
jgi:hypothetical protein